MSDPKRFSERVCHRRGIHNGAGADYGIQSHVESYDEKFSEKVSPMKSISRVFVT